MVADGSQASYPASDEVRVPDWTSCTVKHTWGNVVALAAAVREHVDVTREVIPVALSARAAKKLPTAIADLATVAPASLAAVIATGLAIASDWEATIRGWSRVVRDGGVIVIVDRGGDRGLRHEASRRALCGGLSEIEQRHAGRAVITSGLVSHLG